MLGSFLPALLLGVAFADFLRGVKMDSGHNMTGGFFDLLSPYALLGGVVTLTLFLFHGSVFLALRTEGPVAIGGRPDRGAGVAPVTGVAAVAFLLWTSQVRGGWVSWLLAVGIAGHVPAAVRADVPRALRPGVRRDIAGVPARAGLGLRLPVAGRAARPQLAPRCSLTVHNASSSHYTLVVMTVVALIFTPIVLAYQAWTYWVFRARVGVASVGPDAYGASTRRSGPAQGRRSRRPRLRRRRTARAARRLVSRPAGPPPAHARPRPCAPPRDDGRRAGRGCACSSWRQAGLIASILVDVFAHHATAASC